MRVLADEDSEDGMGYAGDGYGSDGRDGAARYHRGNFYD
jgi:hypothetical protein